MIKRRSSNKSFEAVVSLIFFIGCFAILFPDLFLFTHSPMGGTSAALKDPSVSWAAFMPAFREFRYELLENGNVLWSNLRSLGLPMLGNGVQGAPLFPLNLVLIWLPDRLYWSIMPISRIVLIAWGLYLVSRHIFKLSPLASLIFAILAGFNINMIRWINHPWSNGILAGVWYLYFCCSVFDKALAKRSTLGWHCCGLVLSVFAMVTCGFPEASVAATIMTALLFLSFVLTNFAELARSISKRVALIFFCHVIGFCLSAVQLFALLEFIIVSDAMELRAEFSSGIYKPEEAITFALAQFTSFWFSAKQLDFTVFHLGLFGSFFMLRGLVFWLKTTDKPWFGVTFIALMSLYLVKSFGLSELVENVFARIPILAQSHFPLYFPILFYFGACYFCAIGVQSCVGAYQGSRRQQLFDISVSLFAIIAVLVLAGINVEHFNDIEWHGLIGQFFSGPLAHLRIFVFSTGFLVVSLVLCAIFRGLRTVLEERRIPQVLPIILLCSWLIAELHSTLPKDFASSDHWSLNLHNNLQDAFIEAELKSNLSRNELRGTEQNGDYLKYGIATINNGVSAMMPVDQRLMRTNLFHTQFEGYWPALKSLKPWSWEALSANLITVDTTPRTMRLWAPDNFDQSLSISNASRSEHRITDDDALLYLEGATIGFFKERSRILPWLYFRGAQHDFWVEANIKSQQMLGKRDASFEIVSNWRIRIPRQWLKEDRYQVTVRLENETTDKYSDATPFVLSVETKSLQVKREFLPSKYADLSKAKFLANTADERLHLYLSETALPRAYVASSCMESNSIRQSLEFLRDSDAVLGGEVILIDSQSAPIDFCSSYKSSFERIPVLRDRGSSLSLDEVEGPALVILNDYHYPGWEVSDLISGLSFDIVKANSIFRGVFLPEKRAYKLQFDYQPWWLNLVYGLLLLAGGLILLGVLWLRKSVAQYESQEGCIEAET